MTHQSVSDLFDLSGRSVLVTGAASGLGRAMAEITAAAGETVIVADIDESGATHVAAAIEAADGKAHALTVDVADPDAVTAMAVAAERLGGGLDVVFANAGISAGPGPVTAEGRLENVLSSGGTQCLQSTSQAS